ncbi:type III polyketide synthase [Microbacterium sp. M3]|uniref:Type III polyketide synthase n=1 Tax=Microbacterium arthrosphaerae TaxID=792652 RepID=A0ABU4H422_9MICO|nr:MULTISPECIES: type III polyketide synthase [Microbacterium]MDW4574090.1 type III polyketide synthase [Microbacterium arthrosphaerae]MDW7607945.1 type III polyketide synthase [Microbacterium sp. M3]
MTARIVSIGTAVPPTRIRQEDVRDLFAGQDGADRLTRRRTQAVFDASAIAQRHTVIDELAALQNGDTAGPRTFLGADGTLLSPTTGTRNDVYTRAAPELTAAAARSALAGGGVEASAITHVVTVSCTGFFAPGPDYRLVRDLGLSPTVERAHLGFIGCAAALPALRVATALATSRPGAVVLVVCTELCTLHVRASADPQQIVAASVFADGAAAAIVTADPAIGRGGGLELDRFGSVLTDEGETDMVWTIGDNGFEMILSAEVPRIIGREIRGAVGRFLGDDAVPEVWAVHPGGRSVLDRVEGGLELAPHALAASRAVLRDFGNMSSATILFILAALLRDDGIVDGARVAGLAFGPGLTVESALMTRRRPSVAADDDVLLALAASV